MHANPEVAQDQGFIVLRSVAEPSTVYVRTWYGDIRLLCDGDIEFKVGDG